MESNFNKCLFDLGDHIQKLKIFKNDNLEITIEHLKTLENLLDEFIYQVLLKIPSLNSSRVSAMEIEVMDSQDINNRINDLSLKISEQCFSNPILRELLHAILDVNIDLLNKIDELDRRLDEKTNS